MCLQNFKVAHVHSCIKVFRARCTGIVALRAKEINPAPLSDNQNILVHVLIQQGSPTGQHTLFPQVCKSDITDSSVKFSYLEH